ncbi:hypothetical protein HDU76_007292, partial [Blyttiomyces sp. JEL0837]
TTKGGPLGSTNLKKGARKKGQNSIFGNAGSRDANGKSAISSSIKNAQKRKADKENVDPSAEGKEKGVTNPRIARGRGRPPKRLKSCLEKNASSGQFTRIVTL